MKVKEEVPDKEDEEEAKEAFEYYDEEVEEATPYDFRDFSGEQQRASPAKLEASSVVLQMDSTLK